MRRFYGALCFLCSFHLLLPMVWGQSHDDISSFYIRGLSIHPTDPYQIQFIIENSSAIDEELFLRQLPESLNDFFTALTLPNDQLWVNLSPYESHRIMPSALQKTSLGQTLLAADYQLKKHLPI